MTAQAEFDAEQEYLKTLSYLSPEEQQKYTERQGVSFMYQKPPGYDAAMSKIAGEEGPTSDSMTASSPACASAERYIPQLSMQGLCRICLPRAGAHADIFV